MHEATQEAAEARRYKEAYDSNQLVSAADLQDLYARDPDTAQEWAEFMGLTKLSGNSGQQGHSNTSDDGLGDLSLEDLRDRSEKLQSWEENRLASLRRQLEDELVAKRIGETGKFVPTEHVKKLEERLNQTQQQLQQFYEGINTRDEAKNKEAEMKWAQFALQQQYRDLLKPSDSGEIPQENLRLVQAGAQDLFLRLQDEKQRGDAWRQIQNAYQKYQQSKTAVAEQPKSYQNTSPSYAEQPSAQQMMDRTTQSQPIPDAAHPSFGAARSSYRQSLEESLNSAKAHFAE